MFQAGFYDPLVPLQFHITKKIVSFEGNFFVVFKSWNNNSYYYYYKCLLLGGNITILTQRLLEQEEKKTLCATLKGY